jgi:glycosyltransferase involved in cell wall biosynthesis
VRILFVSDVFFPRVNGVSTSIQTFRRELTSLGHETVLVAPEYPTAHPDDAGIVRIASRRVPLDPEDRAMRWTQLRAQHRRLAGRRFDLVHIQTPFLAHYAGVSLARRWGIPAVATYHTLFEEYLYHYAKFVPRGAMRALARGFSRSQCNALDAVLVPSAAMRETLERYGVEVQIAIVPTGIRLPEFVGGDGARFRARHGIQPGRPVALFVGRVAFEKNIEFLVRERGVRPEAARAMLAGMQSDPDAEYEEVIEIDAHALRPMIALPGDPGNGLFISELGAPVKVDIAYAGSCTAGKKEDMDMYARVLKEAAEQGERIHPEVRFYIQFGSQDVKRYAERQGYVEIFRAVGAEIIEPSCGACINAGPGVSYDRQTVTVSAINRNFPGRSGPGQLYLASPYTTAASALAGFITAWEPEKAAV